MVDALAVEQLPWHAEAVDAPLAAALGCTARDNGRRLIDLGTGAGTVAIEAARRGYAVTATDIAPSALRYTRRERAGELPIQFVLDDITTRALDGQFDVAVDAASSTAFRATSSRRTRPA